MPQTIALVACVKTKTTDPQPARLLYTSDLFTSSAAYVESITKQWYILSAEYGLVHPDAIIAPYEKTLNNMPAVERRTWAEGVLESLNDIIAPGDEIIFLASIKYRQYLIKPLESWGCKVSIPMEGLQIGYQKRWLKKALKKPVFEPFYNGQQESTAYIRSDPVNLGGKTMSLANQIREHVISNYLEPARKSGRTTVKITAKNVHTDLGLKSRYPAVCSALDGDIFKEQAKVILRSRSGPRQSSTVIWEYEIL